jgi:hypothetical protein
MSNIKVKTLSGDIFSLTLNNKNNKESNVPNVPNIILNIISELNKLNPFQFPLKRTILIKDNDHSDDNEQLYYAYIHTHLCIYFTHYAYEKEPYKAICKEKDNDDTKEDDILDGLDGKVYGEFRGMMAFKVKFPMVINSYNYIYRLFVISIINLQNIGPFITYSYDTNEKDDYIKVATLIKNKEIKLNESNIKNHIVKLFSCEEDSYEERINDREDVIIVLDFNGKIVYNLNVYSMFYSKKEYNL